MIPSIERATAESRRQLHPATDRRRVNVAGRLTWLDASDTLRFVSVVAREVGELDAYVECQVPASIPIYRKVYFQVERDAAGLSDLPPAFRRGKVLSAIWAVGPIRTATGTPEGYTIRLLIEPVRPVATSAAEPLLARERHAAAH